MMQVPHFKNVTFIETKPERARSILEDTIQSLTCSLCILSISTPAKTIRSGQRTNVTIIDCTGQNTQESDSNTIFIKNASSLAEMSAAISAWLEKTQGERYFILDSLPTLAMYNPPSYVARFAHTVATKTRLSQAGCVFLSAKESISQELRAEIVQICDAIIQDD
ncbi:hypothetical protein D6783_03160 [Candidatus Woesearchaeota archaeon]|nr:MAG: hypothetical protein D6783_03160 [Candidatus Woesearchaeota archaeon]